MRSLRLTALASLLVVAGVAAATGCAFSPDVHSPASSENRCATNADCPSGSTCAPTTHACVSVNATTEVVFYAAPPNGAYTATAAPTRLDSNIVSGDSAFDIRLRAPRLVYGMVAAPPAQMGIAPADGGTTEQPPPVPATLQFRRQGSTPLEPIVTVRATSEQRLTPSGFPYNFTANLVPGTYDVTITPDASATARVADLPPWYVQQVVPADVSGEPLGVINLVWGATPFEGVVLNAVGEPVPNVAVRLIDHRNGDRALSTTAQTDGTGHFIVRVSPAPDANGWPGARVEVFSGVDDPSEQASTRFVYQIDRIALPPARAEGLQAVPLQVSSAALAPYLTCDGCVPVRGTVEGDTGTTGTHLLLAGATVMLRNDAPFGSTLPAGHVAWFQSRLQTAADATYSTLAPVGTYRALVVPPSPPQFAVTSTPLEVSSNGLIGTALQAPLLSGVRGTLRDVSRDDVARVGNAVIEFIPFAAYLPSGTGGDRVVDLLARRAQTVTQPDGSYSIGLDPGPYRVVVRPPPESGYANQVYRDSVAVMPGSSSAMELPIPLDPPVQVRGQVVDALQQPVGRAMITAFARIAVAVGPNDPFVPPLDIELGTFVADADGQYSCLLPHALH